MYVPETSSNASLCITTHQYPKYSCDAPEVNQCTIFFWSRISWNADYPEFIYLGLLSTLSSSGAPIISLSLHSSVSQEAIQIKIFWYLPLSFNYEFSSLRRATLTAHMWIHPDSNHEWSSIRLHHAWDSCFQTNV